MQINHLVARGLGWAFVVHTDNLQTDKIAVLNMPELTMSRTTYLAMRADRELAPAAERFRKYVLGRRN